MTLEEIHLKAEAGLCQMTFGGARAFLQDIYNATKPVPVVKITKEMVTELRELSGAGYNAAHNALEKANGNIKVARGIIFYTGMAVNIGNRSRDDWIMERARLYAADLDKLDT